MRHARTLIAALVAAAAAVSAHAQPAPASPADFAAAAVGAHAYEIMAAHAALAESKDPGVRDLAEHMIRDHAAAAQAMREAAARSGLEPPAVIVGANPALLLAALQNLRGPEFDKAYLRQQALAHREALTTQGGYAQTGADANLRAAAQADVPMIAAHLKTVEDLRRARGD